MTHLNKYLCRINKPDFQTGPFSVRLKYELKNKFFDQKKSHLFPIISVSVMSVMTLMLGMLIIKPQTAYRINQLAFNHKDNIDFLLFNPDDNNDFSNISENIKPVSSNNLQDSPLSMIEEDKSYILHKLKDDADRTIIYISEVKKKVQPKILY